MTGKKKTFLIVVITAVVSCTVTSLAKDILSVVSLSKNKDISFVQKINAVNTFLEKEYLYDFDNSEMNENAVKAYVESLNEPYTHYYPAPEFLSYIGNIQEGYVGIGVVVGINSDNLIEVISAVEDGPAFNMGIMPGDILKAVDGVEYDGNGMTEAVNAIRIGKEGTTVELTILRNDEEISVSIERKTIHSESVKSEMLEKDISYMRITGFNMPSETDEKSTHTEFKEHIAKLQDGGMKKLIIDLRDNPGGILTEVCDIADDLLPEGVITYIEDKNGERKYYNSDANSIDIPLVVLINGNSASASEVLTGALKDYGKAVIVGETSYGKGIVQNVYSFSDGSGISMTSAKYYTPNGICIHDKGIEPDVKIDAGEEYKNSYITLTEHKKDIQLQKALEIIREK